MSTCAMGVAEFGIKGSVDCFEAAGETSLCCLHAETMTAMLFCNEDMPAASHVAEAGPGIVEVPLVAGQCCMLLPERFRRDAAFLSELDWRELCEKGIRATVHDMEQREIRGMAHVTGFVWPSHV